MLDHSYVLGDFVWTSLDYLGESGIGRVHFDEDIKDFLGDYPWHQANCGDLDLCGFKRPQSYYRDMLWDAGSAAVHRRPPARAGGQNARCFRLGLAGCVAELELRRARGARSSRSMCIRPATRLSCCSTSSSLGRKPAGKANKYIASFEVNYEPGELKAVGYIQGVQVQEATLSTTGPATSLRLTPDRDALHAEPGDLSYVTVEIIDAAGRVLPNADRTLTFHLSGPGEIAAVGSPDPISAEDYRGSTRTTHRGRALVVVKTSGKPGTLRLKAEAEGLPKGRS